ncbi:zinc-dependent peptidase [Flavobacteriaceae bacterium GF1]
MWVVRGVDIFAFACLFFLLSYLIYIVYYAIGLYDLNPFLRPNPLNENEKKFLRERIARVRQLNGDDAHRFYKRVAWFRAKKAFLYKGLVNDKHTIELLISGAGVLLTLGMNNYKYIRSVHKIVIYPTDYYSILNRKHHVGEYNRGLKTLVFAADSVEYGFKEEGDNINLAIHEFAHALYFETNGRSSWESLRFQWGFKKLRAMKSLVKDTNYLRSYAQVNDFEFFSVLVEHFFETPEDLKRELPEAFELIARMLNQKEMV